MCETNEENIVGSGARRSCSEIHVNEVSDNLIWDELSSIHTQLPSPFAACSRLRSLAVFQLLRVVYFEILGYSRSEIDKVKG